MRAIAAGCLALGLLVSGCSAADDRSSAPEASSSPAADASPPADSAPSGGATSTSAVPEPPPGTNDRQGRTAFAEYVLEAWIYALNTNDPKPLLSVSGHRPCDGCRDLVAELAKRKEHGWHVALQGVRVASTRISQSGSTSRAVLSVEIPASSSYNEDGTFRAINPAHPESRFTVQMTHTGGRFRLDSFSLY
jgi:hypothetical protein